MNNNDVVGDLIDFLISNNLNKSADELIDQTYLDKLSTWDLVDWLKLHNEYHKQEFSVTKEYEMQFDIVLIYNKNEVIAIGMVRQHHNITVLNNIIGENNLNIAINDVNNINDDNFLAELTIVGFKLANIAVNKKFLKQSYGSMLLNNLEDIVIRKTFHHNGQKIVNHSAYIWGEGGEGVNWQNFGFTDQEQYITSLKRFYENNHYNTQNYDGPFLFYKYYAANTIQNGGYYLDAKKKYMLIKN